MTAATGVGLGVALAAALVQNCGFLLQHRGARDLAAVNVRAPVSTLRMLGASPMWVGGLGLGLGGFVLHVLAISLAPLSLVQAFVAGGLAFSVPLAAVSLGAPLAAAERRAVLVMAAALVVLPLGLRVSPPHRPPPAGALAGFCAVVAIIGLTSAAVASRGNRAAGLGIAAGALYGVLDTIIKELTELAHSGGLARAVALPWFLAAAAVISAAFFAFQRALQSDRPLTAIALMEATADGSSILAGFVVFGDRLGTTTLAIVAHLLAFVVVAIAASTLAAAPQRLRR